MSEDKPDRPEQPGPPRAVKMDERQHRVWKQLVRFGENGAVLRDRYIGTLAGLQNDLNPEAACQAANSARSLIEALYEMKMGKPWRGSDDWKPVLRELCEKRQTDAGALLTNIQAVISYYEKGREDRVDRAMELIMAFETNASESNLRAFAERLCHHNTWLNGVVHHSNVADAQKVTDAIYDFEELVDLAAARHFDKHHVIERALNVDQPTTDDLRPLRSLLCNRQRAYYFWTNLRNPNWFPILLEDKLFELSPNATSKDDSCTEDEFFPQAEYLKKIASMHPADIAKIVEELSITQNGIVARDLANVILALPIAQAGEQVSKKTTKRLLELDRGGLIPEIFGKLCVRMAEELNGKSIRLADQVLTILRDGNDEITCVVDAGTHAAWMYGRVAGALVPKIAPKYPLVMVKILSQQLKLWIWKEYPASKDDPTGDYSHYKRLKIGADSDQYGEALLHTLVDCLVKALLIAQNSDDNVDKAFGTIRKVQLPIFRRIEMYVMSDKPGKHLNRIAELARDPVIVRNPVLDFELGCLLEKSFPQLALAAREAYLQIVEQGPADPEDH